MTLMKKCSWCGKEYPDEVVMCPTDHTRLDAPGKSAAPAAESAPARAKYSFVALSEADKQKDLVTLVTCGTLPEANLVAARLNAEGIEAFVPDENLMQVIGWNLNTFGYVRVQVSPKDYDLAKEVLSAEVS